MVVRNILKIPTENKSIVLSPLDKQTKLADQSFALELVQADAPAELQLYVQLEEDLDCSLSLLENPSSTLAGAHRSRNLWSALISNA